MARWPFRNIPHTQKQKGMISRCMGWREITRSALLIKWKSRKIVLGVQIIELHLLKDTSGYSCSGSILSTVSHKHSVCISHKQLENTFFCINYITVQKEQSHQSLKMHIWTHSCLLPNSPWDRETVYQHQLQQFLWLFVELLLIIFVCCEDKLTAWAKVRRHRFVKIMSEGTCRLSFKKIFLC